MDGNEREFATCFVLNDEGYILTGSDNGTLVPDLYALDPELLKSGGDPWIKKNALDSNDVYTISRKGACAFISNGEAYITLGKQQTEINSTWHYISTSDTWARNADFIGTERSGAVSFTIDNQGFVALGEYGTLNFDDLWQFVPFP